jgi:hypothetical protein
MCSLRPFVAIIWVTFDPKSVGFDKVYDKVLGKGSPYRAWDFCGRLAQGVARRLALPWAIIFRAFSPSQAGKRAVKEAEDDKNSPPEKLTLAFSTADVVVLGWRIGVLADKLRENDLASVRIRPKRYVELDRFACVVTSIKITPIEKQ